MNMRPITALGLFCLFMLFAVTAAFCLCGDDQSSEVPADDIDDPADPPTDWELLQNDPNPFCSADGPTSIEIVNILHSEIRIVILDKDTGDELRVLTDGMLEIGPWIVDWDGRDEGGNLMPAGFYPYRMTVTVNDTVRYEHTLTALQCCDEECATGAAPTSWGAIKGLFE